MYISTGILFVVDEKFFSWQPEGSGWPVARDIYCAVTCEAWDMQLRRRVSG
jgi:hypothetical protein